MAEFMNKPRKAGRTTKDKGNNDFAAFGKPVPNDRRAAALKHIRAMGIENNKAAWECIEQMSSKIEHDDPYGAMEIGMHYIDLTGTYRLMAVLCTEAA